MKISFAFSFLIFIPVAIGIPFLLPAQQIWYFGNGAGLDFSSGTPKSVYDGKLFTLEGCATACDDKGRLLFYTDGITVWNKYHKEMQNGTGLNGSPSSTQSALIVLQPGTKDIFFLFTTDEKGGTKGLCYSVIDLSEDEGVVTQKNIKLLKLSAEKITAVRNESGKGFWVISHQWNSNNFYVFPVTVQGVGKPVISPVGTSHAETGAGENREAIGCFAVSPDGKKVASVICYRAKNNLELFDFNNSTGRVSNALAFTLTGSPYGLAFSPDNSKLYISFLKGRSGVVQFDLDGKSTAEIVYSKKDNSFGTLRLGPDGKIYIARSDDFLDIIGNPDGKGISCNYLSKAIDLSPLTSNFGLPNVYLSLSSPISSPVNKGAVVSTSPVKSVLPVFVNSAECIKIIEKPFTKSTQMVMTDISVCDNEYILSAKNFGASFVWSTLETTQKITAKISGVYRIAITKEGCTITDSVRLRFRKEDAVFTFLPSFSPETEFLNTEFYYEIDDVQLFELKVYDKRKNILFETRNIKKKWNGKNPKGAIAPSGEYLWVVKYKPNCPKDSKLVVQEGKVTVKRKK